MTSPSQRPTAGLAPSPTPFQPLDKGKSTKATSWNIKATKLPILSIPDADKASAELKSPLPEICFGRNSLRLEDEQSGLVFEWDTMGALRGVAVGTEGGVKVAHAKEWAKGQSCGSSSDLKVVNPFDWTYTTAYPGSIGSTSTAAPPPAFQPAPPGHPGIPLHLLARQDIPVTFFEEVPLFEDELGDNGIAEVNVRVRVNEFSWFVLSRFFLRVDGVLFRIFDTRTYHQFGSNEVIRESKGRQAAYAHLKARLPSDKPDDLSPLTDLNWVAAQLETLADSPPQRTRRAPAQWPPTKSITEVGTLHPAMAGMSLRSPRVLAGPYESPGGSPPAAAEVAEALPSWEALGRRLEVLKLPIASA